MPNSTPTFSLGAGKVLTPVGSSTDTGYSVQVQADGKIVVAGYGFALDADAFKDLNVAGARVDADDRLLYDHKGRLFYDADGAGGGDAVLFAKLSYRPALGFEDFFVV